MLKNIKSEYILRKIFEYTRKTRGLLIANKNKHLINKLEITPNDFKEAAEIIEIKLKLSDDPEDYPEQNNNFINIKRDDAIPENFEIYFDGNKQDKIITSVKRDHKISNILIKIFPKIRSFHSLFENCTCIKEIDFINFVRRDIIDMSYMFYGCKTLKKLEITALKTDQVTDMKYMFYGCSSLKEINLKNLNTKNVTNMESLFEECFAFEKLDASNFITDNVKDMSKMFCLNTSLKELNIEHFDTRLVEDMDKMFYNCKSLVHLKMPIFNTDSLKTNEEMFHGCSCLNMEEIDKLNIKPKK